MDNDLISRQAAIDAFGLSEKTRKYGGDHSGYDTRMLYEIQDILEGLPSADSPQGEWIIHDEVKNIYGGIYIECSECGTRFVTQTLEDEHFCRNCGASMFRKDGEE